MGLQQLQSIWYANEIAVLVAMFRLACLQPALIGACEVIKNQLYSAQQGQAPWVTP